MNFIKSYPRYYMPIIIAPFLIYRYKCNSFLNEKYKRYHEFNFKGVNCHWCDKKIGENGKCDECFIRMFNDPR